MINRNTTTFIGLLFTVILLGLTSALQAAVILQHPADRRGIAGDSVLFTVVAADESATYQWLRDGNDIAGATEASYVIETITADDNEAWFQCRVTVDGESETSLEAQLVILQKGDYDWDGDIDNDDVRHLQNNLGKQIARQWFYPFWDFPGKKKKKYKDELSSELAEFDWNDDGRINGQDLKLLKQQCTNSHCRVIEPEPPVIVGQPVSEKLLEGDYGMFRVDALGPKLHYQWRKNGEDILGATRFFLLLKRVPYQDNGSIYQCVITNDDGTAASREVVLTVFRQADLDLDGDVDKSDLDRVRRYIDRKWRTCPECDLNQDRKINSRDLRIVKEQCDIPNCEEDNLPAPEIIQQPRHQSAVEKTPVTFTVAAVGKDLTFQWLRDGNEISGATKKEYTIKHPEITDDGSLFQCKIGSGSSSVLTGEVTLNVYRQGDFDWDGDIDEDDIRVVRKLLFRPGWMCRSSGPGLEISVFP